MPSSEAVRTRTLPAKFPQEGVLLSSAERQAIGKARWFSSLSGLLKHDIIRQAYVRSYKDGDQIALSGERADFWMACVAGSVCVASSPLGKQITLAYLKPGNWFGDSALMEGGNNIHNATAHGQTRVLCVSAQRFDQLLHMHPELPIALLKLHARRVSHLYSNIEDARSLPARIRLVKQLLQLASAHGVPVGSETNEIRINLKLCQTEMAHLVGTSRQRLNAEIKLLERECMLRLHRDGLVVRVCELMRILQSHMSGP